MGTLATNNPGAGMLADIQRRLASVKTPADATDLVALTKARKQAAKDAKLSRRKSNDFSEAHLRAARHAGTFFMREAVPREPGKRTDRTSLVQLTGFQEVLEDCAISRPVASIWEKLARIPQDEFETYLKAADRDVDEIGIVWLLRLAAVQARDAISESPTNAIEGVYDVLIIDPPWPIEKIQRTRRPIQAVIPYRTLSVEDITSLGWCPIAGELPAADKCHVWLWTTHRFLPDAFAMLDAWSLNYVCTFVWHKPGGFQPVGLPQYNNEFALYARRGTPAFSSTKGLRTCFDAKRGEHSEKPAEFYEMIARCTSGRRLDMFNRRAIEGFDGWGTEAA